MAGPIAQPPRAGATRRRPACAGPAALAACAAAAAWWGPSWAFVQPGAAARGHGAPPALAAGAEAGALAVPRNVARGAFVRIEGETADPMKPIPKPPSNKPKYTYVPKMTVAPVAEPPPDPSTDKQRPFVPTAAHLSYAIVQMLGHQHMMIEGGMYETDFIRAVPGSKVRLNRILLLKNKKDDGTFEVAVGQPLVHGAYAEITILEHLKGEEKMTFKHTPKKHYMRRFFKYMKVTRFRLDKIVWDKDAKDEDVVPPGRAGLPMKWDEDSQIGTPFAADGKPKKNPEIEHTRRIPL